MEYQFNKQTGILDTINEVVVYLHLQEKFGNFKDDIIKINQGIQV